MAKNVPLEVSTILENLDITTLETLTHIANDEARLAGLTNLLSMLLLRDQSIIVKGAGVASSMDTLIDVSNKMSFSRGRMAGYTLVNSILRNAPRFMDKRLEKKTGKSAKPTR